MKLKVVTTNNSTPQDNSTKSTLLRVVTGDPNKPNPLADEMRILYNRPLKYNNNLPASQVVKSAAQKAGVNPALLFSSAFQEGFNKAIAKPDEVSESYNLAKVGNDFPVDGFYNYGLDTFGNNYEKLKKYLPQDFDKRVQFYDAVNEKKQNIKTAAFKNDEDALIAKGAFLRMNSDNVDNFAKQKGITLDDKAKNYFTLVAYNSGEENAQKMLDAYSKAKDKNAWLSSGDKNWQRVHKNIAPRMSNMDVALELLTK